MTKAVLWDFDGTLARRSGGWSQTLVDLMDRESPGHSISVAAILPGLSHGFPWHDWQRGHPELGNPRTWWDQICSLLRGALVEAGVAGALAARVAAAVPAEYTRLDRWSVFPDVVPALDRLTAHGWRHVIVSNHCPELPQLAYGLGISSHFDAILTSATIGYDKPNPEIYALGMQAAGNPAQVWMVGDNPEADIAGAARCGIPGILVRRAAPGMTYAPDLVAAAKMIIAGGPPAA
jgi:putative hydrolase of the HAD superfamily